jgi:hypothetical protein
MFSELGVKVEKFVILFAVWNIFKFLNFIKIRLFNHNMPAPKSYSFYVKINLMSDLLILWKFIEVCKIEIENEWFE